MSPHTDRDESAVAIVGMGVLLPGSRDLHSYWSNLVGGVDAITDCPPWRWDPRYYAPHGRSSGSSALAISCRRGGFVDEFAAIDVGRFGLAPSSAPATEPDHLLALGVAAAAVEDAGGRQRLGAADRIGIIIGRGGYAGASTIRFLDRVRGSRQLADVFGELFPEAPEAKVLLQEVFSARRGGVQEENPTGPLSNLCASRIANRLDFGGPAYTLDAACASSLLAVDQAISELLRRRCDVVLAGGVHHVHEAAFWVGFSLLGALSRSETIRPFDRRADGTLLGEGTGMVVLKRLTDAERDGDRIYAVIRGVGVTSDGRSTGLLAPHPDGQARALTAAWRDAGLDPTQPGVLGLLEAHGTATAVGDRAELLSLGRVFGGPTAEVAPALGSVKSMIGHTMPAAGVAGLAKAALALHHGILPPTRNCEEPSPELLASRFRPLRAAEPWPELPRGVPRRAAVNAFGFGGINSHLVLEQAPGDVLRQAIGWPGPGASRTRPGPSPADLAPSATAPSATASSATPARATEVREPDRILRVAGSDVGTLLQRLDLLASGADQDPAGNEADDRVRAGNGDCGGSASAAVRLGVLDPVPDRLRLARRIVERGEPWRGPRDIWFTTDPLRGGHGTARLAFVFPGLEGDFSPRTEGLGREFRSRRSTDSTGSADFAPPAGDGLGGSGLATQALGEWLDELLRRCGLVPDDVAGYSLGEWTAMRTVGVLGPDSVQRLSRFLDGNPMPAADVAFAILTADPRTVAAITERFPDVVVSHENSPRQTVVCGPDQSVAHLLAWGRSQGITTVRVPVRSGFHTPFLAPHTAGIDAFVGRLGRARTRLWSTTLAAPAPDAEAELRAVFLRHLVEPVRWMSTVRAMHAAGVRTFVQVGVGQLGTLVSESLDGLPALIVSAASNNRDILHQLAGVLTGLWVEGWPVEPQRVNRPLATTTPPSAAPVDLGTPFLRLDPQTGHQLRQALVAGLTGPASAAGDHNAATGLTSELETSLAELMAHGGGVIADELLALLGTATQTASAVAHGLSAAGSGPIAEAGSTTWPVAGPPVADRHVPDGPADLAQGLLPVSLRTMPYLRDHCFFRQPRDWSDETDLWPVMPATTAMHHMMRTAGEAAGGRPAVRVENLELQRWLAATPAVDVSLSARSLGDDRWEVALGEYSRSQVTVADRYPATSPQRWQVDLTAEHIPAHSATQLYEQRILFHGPAFQGITEVTGIGPGHIRGVLTALDTPGALLDSAGQLLGYWIMQTLTSRSRVLPAGIRRLELFGPQPEPGTQLDCLVRIDALTETAVQAGVQLSTGGRVWAQAEGWVDRRFDDDPVGLDTVAWAERRTLSILQPEGWVVMHERWFEAASRELAARRWLSRREREAAERLAGPQRRAHLIGCIAIKDAVRRLLWADGAGDVFPVEILVERFPSGAPVVRGLGGRTLPPLRVAAAQMPQVAVALVRRVEAPPSARPGMGIAVEPVPSAGTTGEVLPDTDARPNGRSGTAASRRAAGLRAAARAAAAAAGLATDADLTGFTVQPGTQGDDSVVVRAPRTGDGADDWVVGIRYILSPPDGAPAGQPRPREYAVAWTG